MTAQICVPLVCRDIATLVRQIEHVEKKTEAIEIWVDYLQGVEPKDLVGLCKRYPGRLVFVFRRKNQEEMRLSYEKRQRLIAGISEFPELIDLDIQLQTDELEWFSENRGALQLLTSYHNFERTPRWEELLKIFLDMSPMRPAIKKLSTYCLSMGDALRLLEFLLHVKQEGDRAIVLGMGEHGVITRVFGALWGNEFTFASVAAGAETAPGQLSVDDLRSVLSVLEKSNSPLGRNAPFRGREAK